MLRPHRSLVLVLSSLLLSTAFATSETSVVSYFLDRDGEPMTPGGPANQTPFGGQLFLESEGRVYSARAELTQPLPIATAGSFHLHLHDREAIDPVDQEFATHVRMFVYNGASQVRNASGLWYLAAATKDYAHPGGSGAHGDGWTELHFDVTTEAPTIGHCNASGCIHFEGGALVIPAGMTIGLEFGLHGVDDCPQEACALTGERIRDMRLTSLRGMDAVGDGTCELGQCVNLHNPGNVLPPSFDSTAQLNRTLAAYEDGDRLRAILGGQGLPRSSWRTASTTSDSRLDIRLG